MYISAQQVVLSFILHYWNFIQNLKLSGEKGLTALQLPLPAHLKLGAVDN